MHTHTHPHAHYNSQGGKAIYFNWKNEKKNLHVETLEKTYTVHNIPDHGGVMNRPSSCGQCASSLPNVCLFSMCSYSTAQCTDRQSFWGRLLKLKNKPFWFFCSFKLFLYVFLPFYFSFIQMCDIQKRQNIGTTCQYVAMR